MTEPAFHSPEHPGNIVFVEFARAKLGSGVQFDNHSREFGRPSIVWRLTGSDGTHAWLKHHEGRYLYERELLGLEVFVPALGTQTWWHSPTLIARDDELRVMLMSEVEGELLDSTPVSSDECTRMFKMAGRFIRKLHDADLPDLEGIDANAANGQGRTAVVTAAWRGHHRIIQVLLDTGVEIDVADNRGRTALSWAAINGHAEITETLLGEEAMVDVRDDEGMTPLIRAAWNGHEKVVAALIAATADVNAADNRGVTALQRAESQNARKIAARLRAAGAR